jgi:hypothetical protein
MTSTASILYEGDSVDDKAKSLDQLSNKSPNKRPEYCKQDEDVPPGKQLSLRITLAKVKRETLALWKG